MEKNLYLTKDKENVPNVNYRTSWNIYPEIIRIVKIKGGENVLDAGCGQGELSNWVKDADLTGVDFREDLANEARKKNYQRVEIGDIEKLKFRDKSFDTSFSIQVFQYLKNPEKAFEELLRVSKRQVIITIPNFKWLKLKSLLGGIHKIRFDYYIKNQNIIGLEFLKKLARDNNMKVKMYHLSNKLGAVRNLIGEIFSSEIMGVYNLNEHY